MLSDADTRAIQHCRNVLQDIAKLSERASVVAVFPGEVMAYGVLKGYAVAADHALAAVLTQAGTYLDDAHAAAAERK
jgi:hypothetical protein